MKKYDIFISYRRNGGDMIAARVHESLQARGYSAFLDVEDLTACEFDLRLMELIRACKDFVLVLTPGSLDRCAEENDWVRREIECALESRVNIVLVLQQDFAFPKELPASISRIAMHNGVVAYASLWSAVIDKLETFLNAQPAALPDGEEDKAARKAEKKAVKKAAKAAKAADKADKRAAKRRVWPWLAALMLLLLACAALYALPDARLTLGTKLRGADWAYLKGLSALEEGRGDDAQAYLAAAAIEGHAKAARELGEQAYFAAEPDYQRAARWFARAEAAGETMVRYYLGWCAEQMREDAEAARWYALAAQDGVTEAMVQLAVMYLDGRGVEKDPQEAIHLFERAAERGNFYAMANLGACYDRGEGVERDAQTAIAYYEAALANGYQSDALAQRLEELKGAAAQQ